MTLALPFRLGNLVVRVLPPAVRYPLAALLGRCAFYAMPRRRQIAMANYGQVLGLPPDHPRTKRTARHAFGNYAKLVADFILMDSLSPEAIRALVRAEGVEHLDRALAQGKGAIAVTAHARDGCGARGGARGGGARATASRPRPTGDPGAGRWFLRRDPPGRPPPVVFFPPGGGGRPRPRPQPATGAGPGYRAVSTYLGF